VIETVFENRYMHIGELNRMGANIKIEGRSAIIQGDRRLQGAQVISTDLRAGAALVLAGLMAEGTTEISEVYHIERGYADFIEKFRSWAHPSREWKIKRLQEGAVLIKLN
jgi:UDP-N-acetylglucosamine 1-carboxyvinyltransferase